MGALGQRAQLPRRLNEARGYDAGKLFWHSASMMNWRSLQEIETGPKRRPVGRTAAFGYAGFHGHLV